MKKRLTSFILCICMLLVAIPTVRAAFFDIDEHWAKDYILAATEGGLFSGTSETAFSPDLTMSRAMFVTVLGRFEGIEAELWANTSDLPLLDVPADAYYAPYVNWALRSGIVNGISETQFAPDAPVTREQMAKMIAFYVEKMGYSLKTAENIPESFADVQTISEWASAPVEYLRTSGILNGSPNTDGSVSFLPHKTASRAEGAAVFCRIHESIDRENGDGIPDYIPDVPSTLSLNMYEVSLTVGEKCQLIATVDPEDSITFESSNPAIVTVNESGLVTCVGTGEARITAYSGGGLSASCTFTCIAASDEAPEAGYPNASLNYREKCMFLFGEYVDEHRYYYGTVESALADMQEVTLNVWDINKNGVKYTKTMTIKVHKNLAATVISIFDEIYRGEEKFPICYLGGWNWAGKSEHTIGTAIDINYPQNYYCDPNGNAIVGDYWKPGEDPYSIRPDGDVVRAFEKYGFRWGVNWNSGYKDYMHFSFFGT